MTICGVTWTRRVEALTGCVLSTKSWHNSPDYQEFASQITTRESDGNESAYEARVKIRESIMVAPGGEVGSDCLRHRLPKERKDPYGRIAVISGIYSSPSVRAIQFFISLQGKPLTWHNHRVEVGVGPQLFDNPGKWRTEGLGLATCGKHET